MIWQRRICVCILLLLGLQLVGAAQHQRQDEFPRRLPHATLENVLKLSDAYYSGGEPSSEAHFAALADLGIKTVVSVDGSRPNIDAARKYGLRYVHIPIGYDGISAEAGRTFANLPRAAEGPFFIHCHHGTHRGPAAAAITCIAAGVVDQQDAIEILQLAGTSKKYAGLWRDVKNYRAPAEDEELPELVEQAEVASLATAMATMDRSFENLLLCQTAGWGVPKQHPDVEAKQAAIILKESLRELQRHYRRNPKQADEFQGPFLDWLAEAERQSAVLETALQAKDLRLADRQLSAIKQSCTRCHRKYRD